MTALVCNCYFNGLSIIQELGRRGVDVHAVDSFRNIGTVSRYADYHRCPNPLEDEGGFIEYLESLAPRFTGKPVLFPTHDHWASAIARHEPRLSKHYRPCVADESVVELLLHKGRFYDWALDNGYPVPDTWPAVAYETIPPDAFPVVAKPDVRRISGTTEGNREKTEYMDDNRLSVLSDEDELRVWASENRNHLDWFVVQEFVRGLSDRMYTVGVYANDDHEVVARFEGRKVRGYPPDSGDCRVGQVERVPDELVETTEELVRDLGFEGIGEFEFKRDARTGEFRLIEVNPRSWSWIGITPACGVSLPWIAYTDLVGRDRPADGRPVSTVDGGTRTATMTPTADDGDVKWARLLDDFANCLYFNSGYDGWTMAPREWWRSLRAEELVVAGVSSDDPLPAAYSAALMGRRLLLEAGGLWTRVERAIDRLPLRA